MSQEFAMDIDAKLRKLTEERKYKAEDIFNLGVQLGRHLEKEKLADVRLSYFAEFDEKTQLRSEFVKLHKSVCDWLERLVRMSIKEQISESKFRDWSIGFNRLYGNNGEFDASIVEKRYVQYKSVRRGEGEHFRAFFVVQGKLKNLFEKHNQPTEFEIIVDNDGDDYVSISKEQQIDSLYGCMISYNCELDREGVESYSKFVNELEKSLLLILLQ
jgi:molybdopterin converting factor small subunit